MQWEETGTRVSTRRADASCLQPQLGTDRRARSPPDTFSLSILPLGRFHMEALCKLLPFVFTNDKSSGFPFLLVPD